MCSEMNPLTQSRSNDTGQYITEVGMFAIAVGFSFPLRLPVCAIPVSRKLIYIQDIRIIIQLHVAEARREGTYKVV
jgi:hypothetical protein